MQSSKLLLWGWIIISFALLLYSFTQVDLNLTLSQLSIWQVIQKLFQYIGYFQRPLSTTVFLIILSLSFFLYITTLRGIEKGILNLKQVWKIVFIVCGILLFSYNAFSYDLFNYMFDARIVSNYHLNPYEYKALDFPNDPMLTFMRSTHRVFPYGQTWLLLTAPLTFIGGEVFLITFYLLKALMVGGFLLTCYFLVKILKEFNVKNPELHLAFFALNPLILIESLVSAHLDVVMIGIGIASLYLLLKKKYLIASILLIFSIGIKFATVFLIPVFFFVIYYHQKKRKIDQNFFYLCFILMTASFFAMSLSSGQNKNPELQPWYLLNVIPFAAFLYHKKLVRTIIVCVSFGMLLFYIPFLYSGEWPGNIVDIKLWIFGASVLVGVLLFGFSSKRI